MLSLDELIEQENRLFRAFSGEDVDGPQEGHPFTESVEAFSQAPQEG